MNSKGVDATAAVSTLGKRKFGASTSASASAASVYEVFLNFCGKDTRKGFTDFLYTYLVGASIQTFRDNDELKVGEEIGPELLKAIKESKISIPIFSKNYATSKWCLLELQQMVECHRNGGQKIFPIFYDVDPCDVRNQRGSYELAFSLHEKKFEEGTVQRWRDALKMVGGLKGLELKNETDGHEGEFVKLVAEKVSMELKKNYMHVPDNLVGMDNHIQDLVGLLDVDSDDVRIVGIHGMGGLGKTTITKVIYNEMCKHFDAQCFLDNVREKSEHPQGIVELQKQFISSVQKTDKLKDLDEDHGRSLIEGVVRGKKFLLVLDDVDNYNSQVNMLMGELTWFGAQSRIIVTTRNKDVLDVIELINCQSKDTFVVYKSYKPKFMNNTDSLQLFNKHAFKRDSPIEEFSTLSKDVVSIAAGLPLVLVVLGSTFFGLKDRGLWEEKVRKLQKIPNKKVLEKLKISFEALDNTEKEIFLDIACLFIDHNKTRPIYMWGSCDLYPNSGIDALVNKSLITIDDEDRFQMHDQLRDLGRQIVHEEGLQKQSRLWCYEEAFEALESNQGTSCVNALRLGSTYSHSVVMRHFHNLPNLTYLSMMDVQNVDGDFKDLLPNLRWLECRGMYFGKFSLRNLNMENLVVLHISNNWGLDDWDGWRLLKMANNLKVLELSDCIFLHTLPNLSNMRMLVELNLKGCHNLIEIRGLLKLKVLQVLNINGCESLRRLPNISSLKDLKVFDAYNCSELSKIKGLDLLISLEYLQLDGCVSLKEGFGDLSNLNKLQLLQGAPGLDFTDFSNFKNLKQLEIYKSNRSEIQDLDELEALEDLKITNCSSIIRLPNLSCLKRLKTLIIRNCEQLIEIQDLSELKSLEMLLINGCRSVKALPDLSPLQKLKELDVSGCEELSEIRGIAELNCLTHLLIYYCKGLGCLPDLPNVMIYSDMDVVEFPYYREIPEFSYLPEFAIDENSESTEYTTDENSED